MREVFLGAYFFLLFYVAFYGIHLYWLSALYLRSRRSLRPPPPLPDCPSVTVQLPIYNEKMVAARLIESVARFDWPRDRLEIQVLDDSDDETTILIDRETARWRAEGVTVVHLHRDTRTGYKAGALAEGLARAAGEYIAVFDADNLPRPDFLRRTIGYFTDPGIGLVQARWSFLNREESLLCRAQALFLDSHFYIEQAARQYGGLFLNFNGTAGVWRRQAIVDAGGWQADTLTEDLDLSYRAQLAGWRLAFAEDVDVGTELPGSIRAFKSQQFRWARGAIQTGRKVLPAILRSSLPLRIKIASFFHLTQKTVSLALLFLALFLIPALFIRLQGGMLKVLVIDLPVFLAGTGSMSMFYGMAFRRERAARSWRDVLLLPAMTSLGIALAANNSLAIWSAVFERDNRFIRTPKAGATAGWMAALPGEYRVRFDRTVKFEILLAGYALAAIGCAIWLNLFFTLPFLITFTFGYVYFAFLSLRENHA